MNSKKLLKIYRRFNFYRLGILRSTWPILYEFRNDFTDEQRAAIRGAQRAVNEAQDKMEAVLGPEIGKAIMHEERFK